MHVTPRELPELRMELWTHPLMGHEALDMISLTNTVMGTTAENPAFTKQELGLLTGGMSEAMRDGELHYIREGFCDLVMAAAPDMPTTVIEEHDLPDTSGVLYFEKPLLTDDPIRGPETHRWMIIWQVFRGTNGTSNVAILPLIDREGKIDRTNTHVADIKAKIPADRHAEIDRWLLRELPAFVPGGFLMLVLGEMPTMFVGDTDSSISRIMKMTLATFNMLRQRLASKDEARPERASYRRIIRNEKFHDPNCKHDQVRVQVVSLRGSTHRDGSESREYIHQWIVKGHWRNHWYAKAQVHRPIFIAPHIKGPEGAPLLGGDKVYTHDR